MYCVDPNRAFKIYCTFPAGEEFEPDFLYDLAEILRGNFLGQVVGKPIKSNPRLTRLKWFKRSKSTSKLRDKNLLNLLRESLLISNSTRIKVHANQCLAQSGFDQLDPGFYSFEKLGDFQAENFTLVFQKKLSGSYLFQTALEIM